MTTNMLQDYRVYKNLNSNQQRPIAYIRLWLSVCLLTDSHSPICPGICWNKMEWYEKW